MRDEMDTDLFYFLACLSRFSDLYKALTENYKPGHARESLLDKQFHGAQCAAAYYYSALTASKCAIPRQRSIREVV
jgi:hypothetical protein